MTLPGRPHGVKLSSTPQTWCTASVLQSLKEVAVNSGPLVCHSLTRTYIPSPGAFIPEDIFRGTSTEAFLRYLLPLDGVGDNFSYSNSIFSTSPLLALSCRIWKTAGTFCSVLSWQWDKPHVCADPLDPWPACHSVGGKQSKGVGTFSGLASCLYCHSLSD